MKSLKVQDEARPRLEPVLRQAHAGAIRSPRFYLTVNLIGAGLLDIRPNCSYGDSRAPSSAERYPA